jgi:hypothetical protein
VCTHDDAPSEELPPNTVVFGAGGNSNRINVPIPLICGPHVGLGDHLRTIPLSFVGSLTHMVRRDLALALNGKPGVYLNITEWSDQISNDRIDLFKRVTERSIFSLCPRGYGATSYRLYEAMQIGAIPIYVSDKHLLPWSDILDWNDFCVLLTPDQIPNIHQIVHEFQGSRVRRMQDALLNVWEDNFTIKSTCLKIKNLLEDKHA